MAGVRVGSAASVLKSDVLKEGWLVKSPPLAHVKATSRKKWRRRWFSLKASMRKLYYYTDDSMKELKGEIDLHDCRRVLVQLEHPKYKYIFSCVCPAREYFLSADSEDEMMSWAQVIASLWAQAKKVKGEAAPGKAGSVAVEVAPKPPLIAADELAVPDAGSRRSSVASNATADDDSDPDDYAPGAAASSGPTSLPPPPPPPPAAAPAAASPPPRMAATKRSGTSAAATDGGSDGDDDHLFAFIDQANSKEPARPSSVLLEFKFPPPPPSPSSGGGGAAEAATTMLYDFKADGDGCKVSVTGGEVVDVMQRGAEWSWIRVTATGSEGYVPTTYLGT